MDEAEADVAGLLGFLGSTEPDTLDQLPEAPQCRDQATHRYRRNFPDEAAITWLGGTILLQQNERLGDPAARYMTLKPSSMSDEPIVNLSLAA